MPNKRNNQETEQPSSRRQGTGGGRRANGVGRCQGGTGRGRCQTGNGRGQGNRVG